MPEFEIYNDAAGKLNGQEDFNNADASYFASLLALLPVLSKLCQWRAQLGMFFIVIIDCVY